MSSDPVLLRTTVRRRSGGGTSQSSSRPSGSLPTTTPTRGTARGSPAAPLLGIVAACAAATQRPGNGTGVGRRDCGRGSHGGRTASTAPRRRACRILEARGFASACARGLGTTPSGGTRRAERLVNLTRWTGHPDGGSVWTAPRFAGALGIEAGVPVSLVLTGRRRRPPAYRHSERPRRRPGDADADAVICADEHDVERSGWSAFPC